MPDRSPTAVYKSTAPSVMDNWKEHHDLDIQRFNERLSELAGKIGETALLIRQTWWGFCIAGFQNADPDFVIPEGWRRYGKEEHHYIPNMRSKAGKKVAAMLESYCLNFRDMPGLPHLILGEGTMGQLVPEKLNGEWFASATVPLGDTDEKRSRLSEVDTNLWEQVPLSTYHLAQEAHAG
ncbi:hypothetical protein ANMWB30_24040 [Arthrobacter sp. MWB30]|nr:hypothetical protein ANMWB30_24040 [Arthrobacter sp. MWB30]